MRHVLLIPLAMVCLQAQTPVDRFTWSPLLVAPAAGVDLRYNTQMTPEGPTLRFRNVGTQEIHFDWYIPGIQSPDQAVTQGRIHVTPGRMAGPLLLPGPVGIGTIPVLLRIRLGDDTGAYWRD
ncbi:MAG: hypothetical protein Q8K67_08180 [Geothrix sp.]|nr:hypothetical protein [Geothrix sp.]